MEERVKLVVAVLEKLKTLAPYLDVLSKEDLQAVCSHAVDDSSVGFNVPDGADQLSTDEALKLLSLVAQYAALWITIKTNAKTDRHQGRLEELERKMTQIDARVSAEARTNLSEK